MRQIFMHFLASSNLFIAQKLMEVGILDVWENVFVSRKRNA